ncbi:MAG: hypothetical protein IRZ08_21905 [Frankia sp.]|nr:hypothetical protein [Frankia sp.]
MSSSPSSSARHDIRQLLARDEAYDDAPRGEPPVTVPRYRRALRAVLDAEPAEPGETASAWTEREREAYRAGGHATLRATLTAVQGALAPPAAPVVPERRHSYYR